MKKTKDGLWRITVRLDGNLKAKVEREASRKRWSMNDFIEEAIIEKLASEEKLVISKKEKADIFKVN